MIQNTPNYCLIICISDPSHCRAKRADLRGGDTNSNHCSGCSVLPWVNGKILSIKMRCVCGTVRAAAVCDCVGSFEQQTAQCARTSVGLSSAVVLLHHSYNYDAQSLPATIHVTRYSIDATTCWRRLLKLALKPEQQSDSPKAWDA